MKQRQGVLGLDTAKEVMIAFLVLAVIGISIILALTSMQTATTATIDTSHVTNDVINETGYANGTYYRLFLNNTNTSISSWNLLSAWVNEPLNKASGYNVSLGLGNLSLATNGSVVNTTNFNTTYGYSNNVSFTYSYVYSYDNGRTSSVVGNITNGLTGFFASAGTVFSILIVVVIILAISIIIWAVGRFGANAEGVGAESMGTGEIRGSL